VGNKICEGCGTKFLGMGSRCPECEATLTREIGPSEDLSALHRIDGFCGQFEEAWKRGGHPHIENYLAMAPEAERTALLRQLVILELEARVKAREDITVEEYQQRFSLDSDLLVEIERAIEKVRKAGSTVDEPASSFPTLLPNLAVSDVSRQAIRGDSSKINGLEAHLKTEIVARLHPKPAPCIKPTQSVADAVALMRQEQVECVLACEGDNLVGIFTERDLMRRVLCENRSLDLPVLNFMTPNPVVVQPNSSIAKAVWLMAMRGYRQLPVVNEAGLPVGLLSVEHILHYIVEHFPTTVYLPSISDLADLTREVATKPFDVVFELRVPELARTVNLHQRHGRLPFREEDVREAASRSRLPESWQRVVDDLREYGETQHQVWGDVDDDLLARYLAKSCSPEEQIRVETAMRTHPEIQEVLEVLLDIFDKS
jgi:CBS domain-containing protein